MKVVFLDIDGVLNSDEYISRIKHSNVKGIQREIDVDRVKLLTKALNETGAKVVVTSTWRLTKYIGLIEELLASYGIRIDTTPFIDNERGLEIKKWLSENQDVENFVIVDDEVFDSFDEGLLEKLVKISDKNGQCLGDGLQPKDVEEIINRLGRTRKREFERDGER